MKELNTIKRKNTQLVMYFLVRSDLRMSKGKIASQVGHAVQDLLFRTPRPILDSYHKNHSPKVCLRIDDFEDLEDAARQCREKGIIHHLVIDTGLTQVAPKTATVLGIGPVDRERIRSVISSFKLL